VKKVRIPEKAIIMATAVHETVKQTVKKGYDALDKPGRPFIALFIALPIFSLGLFLIAPHPRDRLYLAFPDARTGKTVGEVRYVPRKWGTEKKAESVLAEILLGPERLTSLPIVSKDTRIRTVMYRGGVLYADIGPEFLLEGKPGQNFRKDLATINRLLKRNLVMVKRVELLVGGRTPYADEDATASGGTGTAEGGKAGEM